jgi:integrase
MEKIPALKLAGLLDVERAMTDSERRRILDAADLLPVIGGRSKDAKRHKGTPIHERPRRKGYRPWRNRAIIYALIETGMRRAEVCSIDWGDVNAARRTVGIIQKGGEQRRCPISKEGLQAIQDYVDKERGGDAAVWDSAALFLPSASVKRGQGRITPSMINLIMKEVCQIAQVENRTPHSARHGMGVHIIKKSGNPRAVQRQLGHANPATSMQYMNFSLDDIHDMLDDR